MKSVEFKALFRSFLLFFFSMTLLIGVLFFMEYKNESKTLDEKLFSEMRICSFDLVCKEFKIDFAPKKKDLLYKLHKSEKEVSSYFTITGSQKNLLKIYLSKEKYQKYTQEISHTLLQKFLLVLLVVLILSLLFSFYTLSPLRDALRLTEEFIKDILHDFNTPLSTLRLNASMLHKEIGENKKLTRIENAVESILSLQNNLRAYLLHHENQNESIEFSELLSQRVALLEKNYPQVRYTIDIQEYTLYTNKDSLIRILDNLLSNAGKYNKKEGTVHISLQNSTLCIQDSGKGIKNPKKVFNRFYKEQDRGIGIGLHIVKKLCDALDIKIQIKSQLDIGTSVYLDLVKISPKPTS